MLSHGFLAGLNILCHLCTKCRHKWTKEDILSLCGLYNDSVSTASNGNAWLMNNWLRKLLDRNCRCSIEVLSRNVPRETEEVHEKDHSGLSVSHIGFERSTSGVQVQSVMSTPADSVSLCCVICSPTFEFCNIHNNHDSHSEAYDHY
jgi:hypothetical protein